MFSEKLLREAEEMEKRWKRNTEQMAAEPSPMLQPLKPAKTLSGLDLKPAYSPLDIKDIKFEDIGMPGEYPYTRGNRPVHYQMEPLCNVAGYGFNSAEEAVERRNYLNSIGQRFHVGREHDLPSHICVIDLPTQYGFDPDDPPAKGKVGDCGTSLSNLYDYELLYDGLELDKTLVCASGCSSNVIALNSMFATYVTEHRKLDVAKTIQIGIIMFHHGWGNRDHASYPPRTATKLSVETIKWYSEHVPISFIMMDHGYDVAEAGSTPVIEIAFSLANVIEVMEACIKAGLNPNKVAPMISAHPQLNLNFLETIAKIRAWRRVWAKIMKERFGCTAPRALQHSFLAGQTAGSELTSVEVRNNVVRTTVMALAGMLADVEGMWIASFDEALCIPTEEAVHQSVRTGQILVEETDLPHVTDPFGGSYFMESLTSRIEEEVFKTLKRIDDLGGYMKAWESGWLRGQVERGGNDRLRKIDTGERVKVGLNKYRTEDFSSYCPFPRPSEETEQRLIERVRRYRADRDQEKTKRALSKVRDAAHRIEHDWPESCGELHEACIEAAKARASAGEMGRIFREVFGFGYFSG
jgi:methylmalonyl-CoA mutase N-terminal domain/subunit